MKASFALPVICTAFAAAAVHAGVVTNNVGAATTSFQGSPTILGTTNPNQSPVNDTFSGATGSTGTFATASGGSVIVGSGQSFTAPATASKLDAAEFRIQGAGTGVLTLHLFQLSSDPNTVPMTLAGTGTDLLGGGAGLQVSISPNSGNNYYFVFNNTGTSDVVSLTPGSAYLISFTTTDTGGFFGRYGGGDSIYAGGTAVFNGGQSSSGANRDAIFALTTSPVPEPTAVAALACAGVLGLRRRRA